jgi:hypothetical protein
MPFLSRKIEELLARRRDETRIQVYQNLLSAVDAEDYLMSRKLFVPESWPADCGTFNAYIVNL